MLGIKAGMEQKGFFKFVDIPFMPQTQILRVQTIQQTTEFLQLLNVSGGRCTCCVGRAYHATLVSTTTVCAQGWLCWFRCASAVFLFVVAGQDGCSSRCDALHHVRYGPEGQYCAVACAKVVFMVIVYLALFFFPSSGPRCSSWPVRTSRTVARGLWFTLQKTAGSLQLQFIAGPCHPHHAAEADPHGPVYSADHRVSSVAVRWSMSPLCGRADSQVLPWRRPWRPHSCSSLRNL